jgi:hypothetical protein
MAKIADDDRDVDCSDSEQHGLVPGFQWYRFPGCLPMLPLPSTVALETTTSNHGSSERTTTFTMVVGKKGGQHLKAHRHRVGVGFLEGRVLLPLYSERSIQRGKGEFYRFTSISGRHFYRCTRNIKFCFGALRAPAHTSYNSASALRHMHIGPLTSSREACPRRKGQVGRAAKRCGLKQGGGRCRSVHSPRARCLQSRPACCPTTRRSPRGGRSFSASWGPTQAQL